ncbi:MAG: type III toxin-antitoxin system ToxN/AbiQ family toxin [Clostridia bacterium]|nr:type III toxin-antitoxin system ToxN/AbiQ family toxin [Clostridia bacterium]
MDDIKLYEVDAAYIQYLYNIEPNMFRNRKAEQKNTRKYIGVVLYVNGYPYFAPLSSFKEKHKHMKDSIDFIKVKDYAVINLNNMFPVPAGVYHYVDIAQEKDLQYKALLLAEYRYIKSIQEKIRKNAANLYKIKAREGDTTPLGRRCNHFSDLEAAYQKFIK